ncbi:MAG: radical SAM protein [Candidatus Rokuibacteriota bacterium]|nr:MAG: radical SAM protein [Candidatus Rokubacteria bacterium]
MRAPGAILLVACYELGHQPLAVAWPAAALEARGFAPAVLDVSVEPFDPERAAAARVVAISVPMHTALRLGVAVRERVRAVNPGARIAFYGLYAHLNADHLLAGGADAVIGGEAEAALLAWIEALDAGDDRVVPGVRTPIHSAPPRLGRPTLPVPSRAGLPGLKAYAHLEHAGRRTLVAYVEASRGCRHRCRHCPIPPVYGGRFVVVSPDVVLADARQQVEAGAGHVSFGDPDFLNGPRHALRVAEALHAEFPGVTFDFTAKVEHLLRQRRHLPDLARWGCLFVVSAVESLSDVVLAHLDKGHTRADVHALVGMMRETGIALRPTWVAFTPWTTLGDYREMLDFVAAEGLLDHVDPVQYSLRLLVPPGSLLVGSPAMAPHLRELRAEAFLHHWVHPDPRMDALQDRVATLVARAAEAGEDVAATFDRVGRLADEVAGAAPRLSLSARLAPDRRRPPRLTEPWFC